MGKAEVHRVLFHDMPDYTFRYAVTPVFACPTDTSEQSSGRNSGSSHPQIDRRFDPLGHRYSSNVPAFTNEIDYGPVFFALLQMGEVQISQLAASKSAAEQYGENRTVPLSFERTRGR